MALLFECCRFTEHDKAAMMPNTKDSDIDFSNRGSSLTHEDGLNGAEEEEENYEIGEEDEYFTTLRKSSAFTIERYSSKL